jgi:hypothetical protein
LTCLKPVVQITLLFVGSAFSLAAGYIQATAHAYDGYVDGGDSDSGAVGGPLATAVSGPITDSRGGGSQDMYAESYAEFGTLGGYSAVDDTSALPQPYAVSTARWIDTITVTGTPGTSVSYLLSIGLHDSLSGSTYPNGYGPQGWAYLDGQYTMSALTLHDNLSSTVGGSTTASGIYTFLVGTQFDIGEDLSVVASAQAAKATIDAYSTADFALQVLTQSGGYESESGTIYATTLSPEPSTWVNGLLGLIVLLTGRRIICRPKI